MKYAKAYGYGIGSTVVTASASGDRRETPSMSSLTEISRLMAVYILPHLLLIVLNIYPEQV
jgi:hypothetical protein